MLARLLKDCLPEFDGFSVQDIERDFLLSPSPNPSAPHSAANTPDGSSYVMEPSDTQSCETLDELVQSLSTDFLLPYVGKAVLDFVFRVKLPSSKASGAVIVNIEPQDNWNPSYSLMARAAFYCAHLLSTQQGTEFERSHYKNLKKVYSIWVLTHPPRALKGTITRTDVQWKPVVGEAEYAIGRLLGTFDYSPAAVVGLNGYDMGEYGCVIPLLDALLSKDMETDQRLHIIRDEYRIVDSEMGQEARLMGKFGNSDCAQSPA